MVKFNAYALVTILVSGVLFGMEEGNSNNSKFNFGENKQEFTEQNYDIWLNRIREKRKQLKAALSDGKINGLQYENLRNALDDLTDHCKSNINNNLGRDYRHQTNEYQFLHYDHLFANAKYLYDTYPKLTASKDEATDPFLTPLLPTENTLPIGTETVNFFKDYYENLISHIDFVANTTKMPKNITNQLKKRVSEIINEGVYNLGVCKNFQEYGKSLIKKLEEIKEKLLVQIKDFMFNSTIEKLATLGVAIDETILNDFETKVDDLYKEHLDKIKKFSGLLTVKLFEREFIDLVKNYNWLANAPANKKTEPNLPKQKVQDAQNDSNENKTTAVNKLESTYSTWVQRFSTTQISESKKKFLLEKLVTCHTEAVDKTKESKNIIQEFDAIKKEFVIQCTVLNAQAMEYMKEEQGQQLEAIYKQTLDAAKSQINDKKILQEVSTKIEAKYLATLNQIYNSENPESNFALIEEFKALASKEIKNREARKPKSLVIQHIEQYLDEGITKVTPLIETVSNKNLKQNMTAKLNDLVEKTKIGLIEIEQKIANGAFDNNYAKQLKQYINTEITSIEAQINAYEDNDDDNYDEEEVANNSQTIHEIPNQNTSILHQEQSESTKLNTPKKTLEERLQDIIDSVSNENLSDSQKIEIKNELESTKLAILSGTFNKSPNLTRSDNSSDEKLFLEKKNDLISKAIRQKNTRAGFIFTILNQAPNLSNINLYENDNNNEDSQEEDSAPIKLNLPRKTLEKRLQDIINSVFSIDKKDVSDNGKIRITEQLTKIKSAILNGTFNIPTELTPNNSIKEQVFIKEKNKLVAKETKEKRWQQFEILSTNFNTAWKAALKANQVSMIDAELAHDKLELRLTTIRKQLYEKSLDTQNETKKLIDLHNHLLEIAKKNVKRQTKQQLDDDVASLNAWLYFFIQDWKKLDKKGKTTTEIAGATEKLNTTCATLVEKLKKKEINKQQAIENLKQLDISLRQPKAKKQQKSNAPLNTQKEETLKKEAEAKINAEKKENIRKKLVDNMTQARSEINEKIEKEINREDEVKIKQELQQLLNSLLQKIETDATIDPDILVQTKNRLLEAAKKRFVKKDKPQPQSPEEKQWSYFQQQQREQKTENEIVTRLKLAAAAMGITETDFTRIFNLPKNQSRIDEAKKVFSTAYKQKSLTVHPDTDPERLKTVREITRMKEEETKAQKENPNKLPAIQQKISDLTEQESKQRTNADNKWKSFSQHYEDLKKEFML